MWYVVCLFVGAILGVLIMSMCVISDHEERKWHNK